MCWASGAISMTMEGNATERALFEALTSGPRSRNREFEALNLPPAKNVHRRVRRLKALVRETARLASLPDLTWWLEPTKPQASAPADMGWVHVALPNLGYHRQVAVRDYEWQWLRQQPGFSALTAKNQSPLTPQEGPHATHP